MMPAGCGALLGCGLLLVASVWLRPRRTVLRCGSRRDPLRPVRVLLAQAGAVHVSPSALIGVSASAGISTGVVVFATTGVIALAVAAGLAATTAPVAGLL